MQGFINKTDESLYKISESSSGVQSPGYSDLWRASPGKVEHTKTSLELSINTPYPFNGYELEGMSGVFTFSPCSPPYKEIPFFKEKSPQEVADALLSLKHAVVHPHMSGQLSPISTTMHLGHMPSGNIGCPSPPPPPPLTYAVNHSSQMHPMTYQSGGSSQYPSLHTQIHGDPIQHNGHPQQQGMFPSMSVNVSMSMNVVPPNFVNNQYNYNPAQQWGSSQPQHHYADYHHHSPPPGHLASFQTHYSPYPAQSHHYPQSYSLSSDYRSAMVDARNIICKRSDKKETTSTYNVSHYKRSKFIEDKMHSDAHCLENGKINLCRICGKTYARPSTLKTHLRTHSGEKPYKCSTCHKSFSQAANLTAHVRTHSGEKPFRCPICDRKFSQSSSVTTHMRTHSGERPYRCHLCKKAFSDSSTLTKHLRIHSGEKPYQCKLCLLRFSQSGNLNRHMRVHANNT